MRRLTVVGILLALAVSAPVAQQPRPAQPAKPSSTTPKQAFGFNLGDDYQLANYKQIESYWKTLDRESDRMILHDMGKTAEGRTQWMAVVTSPANHRRLARYKEIAKRLALAEGLTDAEARALAKEGKAVVWIDGGLHATETLGAQQLAQTVYEMVSREDEETQRFLDDCIILFVHANPDGNDLVADWYMRNANPQQRSLANLPRLYQKYIGHDNNRDFFASTQPETENINRALYHDWFPQILYNHHQSGPAGTIAWSSPQRDPYNYNLDPLLILGLQALGTHMHQRMATEGKPGVTMASGGPYDGWWNGGIRNTGNFHNVIAILTETIGSPTPMRVAFNPQRLIPNRDLPYPIAPQEWHFRQSVDYSLSFNRGVLDYASRNRENLLFNIYRMGQRSIERGSGDYWTPSPARINAIGETGGRGGNPAAEQAALATLRKPELRDPRAFIIPSNQRDFPTAVKFINALREVNITIHRATREFQANGKSHPAGSFVVYTNQAYRPHVIDMFEPQDHPNVIAYPGAPPTPPYDNAGWTLVFQMGVQFDRALEGFTGPFEKVTAWNLPVPPTTAPCERAVNDCFIALNRALKSGSGAPGRAARIGLWDQYGGSMDSGWTRWILEQFEFPFTRVFPPDLDAGDLNAKYDVLILPSGAIPAVPAGGGGGRGGRGGGAGGPAPEDIPAEYRGQLGRVTAERTIPQLRAFVENGGTVIALSDSAMNLAEHLKLPVENHLMENGNPIPRAKFFVPGSVLSARVDLGHPLAAGMSERTDFFFDNSPVFKLGPNAAAAGVTGFVRFDSATPLRSGWAWGQKYLDGGVLAVEAKLGKGQIVLYGAEILHRAQPHGTFKLLFNAIYRSIPAS